MQEDRSPRKNNNTHEKEKEKEREDIGAVEHEPPDDPLVAHALATRVGTELTARALASTKTADAARWSFRADDVPYDGEVPDAPVWGRRKAMAVVDTDHARLIALHDALAMGARAVDAALAFELTATEREESKYDVKPVDGIVRGPVETWCRRGGPARLPPSTEGVRCSSASGLPVWRRTATDPGRACFLGVTSWSEIEVSIETHAGHLPNRVPGSDPGSPPSAARFPRRTYSLDASKRSLGGDDRRALRYSFPFFMDDDRDVGGKETGSEPDWDAVLKHVLRGNLLGSLLASV